MKRSLIINIIVISSAVALIAAVLLIVGIRTPDDYYGTDETDTVQNAVGTVTLTIRCDAVPDLDKAEHLPDDGMIVASETYEIAQGETVYDILIRAARKHTLQLDTDGTGQAAYVTGLQHLYNGDYGDVSGWAYSVNGQSPMVGCGAYVLSDGDQILWEYSLNLWGE